MGILHPRALSFLGRKGEGREKEQAKSTRDSVHDTVIYLSEESMGETELFLTTTIIQGLRALCLVYLDMGV